MKANRLAECVTRTAKRPQGPARVPSDAEASAYAEASADMVARKGVDESAGAQTGAEGCKGF